MAIIHTDKVFLYDFSTIESQPRSQPDKTKGKEMPNGVFVCYIFEPCTYLTYDQTIEG
ncbi:hypothetical protein GCM10007932_34790 [Vibrio penaeicida]|uniref:Uncharacterized protein n=1 Tax=Vibrio penaeicida TaxID=104609 RepID=A0AAV5NUH4_9VIBR|nr:hypothetical protein GCM10007932_34790 [Vibrio penaeicida]